MDLLANWNNTEATKSRAWVFTLNNYTEEDIQTYLQCPLLKWVVIGKEVGESGTPHLQGYMRFENCVRRATLQKLNPRAHYAPALLGPEFNFLYCTKGKGVFDRETKTWTDHGKDAEFVENGTRPQFNKHIKGILYNLESIQEHMRACVCMDTRLINEIIEDTILDIVTNDELVFTFDSDTEDSHDENVIKRLKTE